MRNAGGYSIIRQVDNDRVRECDTYSCGHCNRIVHVPVKCDPAEIGGMCFSCNTLICKECHMTDGCIPLEERLARAEARYHALRSYK